MTGQQRRPGELQGGDLIHLETHVVCGQRITPHATPVDVEVAAVHPAGRTGIVIEWRGCARFPGGNPDTTGATLYRRWQRILVIGHVAGSAA